MILECNCKHEFQDQTYGQGLRVHTHSGKKDQDSIYYCTVCGDKKNITKDEKKAKKK